MRGVLVAAVAGWLCLATGAAAQEPRYDIAAETCRPYRKGVVDRQWQVSAPRNPLRVGEQITVGLRDKGGERGQRMLVRARIIGAASLLDSKPVTLTGDSFANVEFPHDFQSGRTLAPGGYTVLWQLADGGGFLACDGFVVR